MSILSFLYRNGTWISVPLFGIGLFLLWFFILNVVKLGDKNRICSVPLRAEQDVEFQEPGQVILCMEGPFLTTRFGNLTYELTGSDGISMQGRMCLSRARSTSISRRVRMQLRSFDITRSGSYLLRIKGLVSPQADDGDLFTKPHLPQTIAQAFSASSWGAFSPSAALFFSFYGSPQKETAHEWF